METDPTLRRLMQRFDAMERRFDGIDERLDETNRRLSAFHEDVVARLALLGEQLRHNAARRSRKKKSCLAITSARR